MNPQTPSLDALRQRAARKTSDGFLRDVVGAHDATEPGRDDDRRELRRLFLRHLGGEIDPDDRERFGRFLAEHVEPDDLGTLELEKPAAVVRIIEALYGFRYDDEKDAERLHRQVDHLVRSVLQRFEAQGELEEMFRLLQIAPTRALTDHELMRLRSRARLHESRRSARRRRTLYWYLIGQAALITVVFPLLFINAENGRLQRQIEAAVNVDVESSPERQYLSFRDGLYWSVITAASIGYGDITPRTALGRFIAGTLGTMGVITIGVVAGLVLSWVTPRRLD